MHLSTQFYTSAKRVVETSALDQQKKRKNRLTALLSNGLPTLAGYIHELNSLLSKPLVDLKRVAKIIRSDPSMSAQVLRVCNSALFGFRRRVLSIEEAAILMGSERLRTLVLTCSVLEFAGKRLPPEEIQTWWQHSFLTGMLSERIARWMEYSEREQAYLGGLLHDIGVLPLLIVAAEEKLLGNGSSQHPWGQTLESEKEFFGMNHCEVGRWIGVSWKFFPSFVEVFDHHHHPERPMRDPYLVGIVAAADHYCETHVIPTEETGETVLSVDPPPTDGFMDRCFPQLDLSERAAIAEMLETEYIQLARALEFGDAGKLQKAGLSVGDRRSRMAL